MNHHQNRLRVLRQVAGRAMAWMLILTFLCLPAGALASSAKSLYLTADKCLKDLKSSPLDRQKITAWLNCIGKFEAVYASHPNDSWAPAGMFKAAELYMQLYQLSKTDIYKAKGEDLLARIQNKYPQSAYSGRARTLDKAMSEAYKKSSKIKVIKSKKEETRDKAAMAGSRQHQTENPPVQDLQEKAEPVVEDPPVESPTSDSPDTGDTTVTALRFWSNPEYTRIVVNADHDRPFSHRLLKKDPTIDKPFQRLYVDIEQSKLGKGLAEHTPINDDLLSQARAGQYQPHTVRVVVDIKSFENYKIFSLKDPFRIVIDVWGKNGRAAEPMAQVQDPSDQTGKGEKAGSGRITTDNLKSSDIARQLALGVSKIVIDPGHGGKDPGAPGYIKGVWEKDIVLKLALNLAQKLRDRLKCTVVLTRTKDEKLTLEERTAMANTQRADLFISLHCNAAKNRDLKGFETYILNLATDDQAIAVAARENATSEKNISDLEYILSDLMKHAKIEESSRLAQDVHKAMVSGMRKKYSQINDLGVKQAPFYVLLGARMPSILIETSFLSNEQECKRLTTQAYQDALCRTIADGVETYINATNPKQL